MRCGAKRNAAAVCIAGLWIVAAARAQVEDAQTLVERANGLFADGDYTSALEAYREAEVMQPESPELAYNQGAAYYKLGDYSSAGDAFNRALLTRDLRLEAKIKYNLGDVAYASALEKESDLQEAIDLLKKAIGRYRDAIELDAQDADARANIESAQLMIKDLLDKQQQQQEQQQQDQQQQDQQQESDQQQDQQSQGDQQDQQEREQSQEQQEDGDQQDQRQAGEESSEQQQQPEAQQQSQQGDEMTRDEAERVLQAVRDKERKRRNERARRQRVRRIPVSKDW
ncbi:MAG: tetratricopeptide repeat protein [Phycisphaerae bacterium]